MRGVLPALAGVLFLLIGVVLTWLVAASSYAFTCRLFVEIDNYACWGVMGLPLAAGIGSMALGGVVLLRGILALPLPRQIRGMNSSRVMFVLGLLLFSAILVLSTQLFSGFAVGLNLATFLFVTFLAILVYTGVEWIQIYMHPSHEFEDDSIPTNE